MSDSMYPFAALVGLDTLKLALELAAVDSRLSVLIRGEKGAGKSTAARGSAELLRPGAPFVNLPIGATEDRLLGGLDVERTIKGQPTLKPGLVSQAHQGILYIDEVNLLADHLADALLDTAASGTLVVEREGFSGSQAAEFVLLGSMNPEEGSLRPQLLDRFALVVDVAAPTDPDARTAILERRLAYDADPDRFREVWAERQAERKRHVASASQRVAGVTLPAEMLHHIASRVGALGVKSLRADLAVVRASRAYAALLEHDLVTAEHVDTVLPLALVHRMPPGVRPPTPSPPPPSPGGGQDERQSNGPDGSTTRVFAPVDRPAPRVVVDHASTADGAVPGMGGTHRGPIVASRRTETPMELDVRASVVQAVARTGSAALAAEDLHERVRQPLQSTRFILVVDSSGSHAMSERMGLVKGVVSGLLEASHGRHDEVVVIACRGPLAEVIVEPTSSRADAERALEYLATGGRTPLAHGLELAAGYVTDAALVIVVTDGRANVPTRSEDAWADTRAAAAALRCAALIVDTEDGRGATGRPKQLADAMGATYARLDALDPSEVLSIVRRPS